MEDLGSEVSGYLMDSEEKCLKELVDQLERERRNLLLGNREMSWELNKIDASNTTIVSTLRKLARENSLLRMELATAREREDSSRREAERSEGKMECLSSKVVLLRQALQQASTASSLNASLQQEVTRLTEDNLVSCPQLSPSSSLPLFLSPPLSLSPSSLSPPLPLSPSLPPSLPPSLSLYTLSTLSFSDIL